MARGNGEGKKLEQENVSCPFPALPLPSCRERAPGELLDPCPAPPGSCCALSPLGTAVKLFPPTSMRRAVVWHLAESPGCRQSAEAAVFVSYLGCQIPLSCCEPLPPPAPLGGGHSIFSLAFCFPSFLPWGHQQICFLISVTALKTNSHLLVPEGM